MKQKIGWRPQPDPDMISDLILKHFLAITHTFTE